MAADVDLLFAHRPDARTPIEEVVRAMNALIDAGKTFYWGTSEWPATLLAEARDVANRLGMVPPCCEQCSYSMLLRERVELEYLPLYPELGLSVYSPLAGGALTGEKPELAEEAGATEMLERLRPIAARLGCSLAQLALAWAMCNERVSTALFGASSPQQLEDNLGALEVLPKLTAAVMAEVEHALQNEPLPEGDVRFTTGFRTQATPLAKV